MEDPLLDYHFDYRVFCLDLVALRVFSFKSISFSLKIEFCVFLSRCYVNWSNIMSLLWVFTSIYFVCLGFTRFCVSPVICIPKLLEILDFLIIN